MVEHKLIRIDREDDPDRCQSSGPSGQCPYKRQGTGLYCHRHAGNKDIEAKEREQLKNYRLTKWRHQLEEKVGTDDVKGLREEIGILRIVMEETLNKCTDAAELIQYSGRIADLAMKIEKLVVSCNRLESNLGMMLDKAAALALSGELVEIISRYIKDDDQKTQIADEIMGAIIK